MRFQVLGPVAAYGEQGPVPLGPARQRTVLAVLLSEPGMLVSSDQLVDRVWGAASPLRARETLHSYLSRLRGVLGGAGGPVLARRSHSYVLETDPSTVDCHQFRAMSSQARVVTDDERAARLWSEALGLWRGTPFADLDSDWLRTVAVALEAERVAALLERNDVLLRRGQHGRLLPELSVAVAEHPLDERLAGQLMLALYRGGRQADALAHYRQVHARLLDELGSDPGPQLRELHQRILRQEPDLAVTPVAGTALLRRDPPPEPNDSPDGVTVTSYHRPAQLPADVAGFTGRGSDLERLDALLGEAAGDGTARAVVITAIGGTAGVGKTALALHWSHRVASRFPDGQLYVNLRGYHPDQPLAPADALARFLTALGVTGQDIPLDVDERAARYRSEVAGRRMLIVLDNAATVAQVRLLLPGSGSSMVVVTSRDSLAGLVAVHGAHRLDLGLLPCDEAVGLLRQLIGSRVDAEPEAAVALAEQCVRLPLALRVAAELAISRPTDPLAELVAELADRQARLELLDGGGDPHAAVRMVFSWSVQHLPPEAVRTFRLLGLHPGPDLDPWVAAALADTSTDQAHRALKLLARAHLVHRSGPGRYGMHDLLRAYAAQLAATEETDQQRQAAEERLLDYYRAAAVSAVDTLYAVDARYRPEVSAPAAHVPDLSEPEAARAWLEAERFCLVAVASSAVAATRSDYVVDLARILHRYLDGGYPTDAIALNGHAYQVAQRAGDIVGQAHALRQLGTAYNRVSRYEVAAEHLQQALARFRQAADLAGEALTLTCRGTVAYRLGNPQAAMDDHLQALALSRRTGDRLTEATALSNLGNVESHLRRYESAADHHQRALAIAEELGSQFYIGTMLNNLGLLELMLRRYASAGDHLRRALTILRQLSGPNAEAHVLDSLGTLHLHLGEPEQAAAYLRRALALCRQAGIRMPQSFVCNGLGEAARLAGEPADAVVHHTEALVISAETSARSQEARAHAGLGHAHHAQGDPDRACSHYEQAWAIYTELDMPEAEEVLAHLTALRGAVRR